jgi:hypothetical protein
MVNARPPPPAARPQAFLTAAKREARIWLQSGPPSGSVHAVLVLIRYGRSPSRRRWGDMNEENGLFRALRLERERPSEREAGAAPVRPRYMSRRLRDDVRLSVVPTCQRAADGRRLGICAWGDDQARKHNRQEDERSPHDLSFLYPQLPALGWGARWRNRAVAARAPRPSFVQYLESTFLRTERARRYPFPRPARRLTCKTSENRGRILPKQATTAKKCDRCGGSFVPRGGSGRPQVAATSRANGCRQILAT